MHLFLTSLLTLFSLGVYAQHNHDHTQKASTIRDVWGDFDSNELIKIHPTDFTKTPIAKRVLKNGSPKPMYKYLDSIEIYSMVYNSDDLMVSGFMVRPKKPGNYPCIIYNRGGNRDFGRLLVAHAVLQMGQLAAQGYVVIGSNYRGNSNSEGIEEFGGKDVHDVLNLIPALGQVEHADTSRIGMLGISRGGMMTYLSMKQCNKIDAAVVLGGVSNLITSKENRSEMESHVYAEIIPHYADSGDVVLKNRSAAYWPQSLSPETELLMLHGESDERVSVKQAQELHRMLKEQSFPHVFMEFERDNHGCTKHRSEVTEATIKWFEKYLKNKQDFDEPNSYVLVK